MPDSKAKRAYNYITRNIINAVSCHIKVKKGRIYVSSFSGRFCDSPKQIAIAYKASYPSSKIIYSISDTNKIKGFNFIPSIFGTWKDAYYKASANIIIDNGYGGKAVWLKSDDKDAVSVFNKTVRKRKKKNQYVISTWHGTPLKKMGIDAQNSSIIDFDCPNTQLVLGNQWTADVMKRLTFDKVPITITGTPRNDLLFSLNDLEISEKKIAMGIDPYSKVLLYAPTFRDSNGEGSIADIENSGINQTKEIDFNVLINALTTRFGGKWTIILRFHHYVESQMDWNSLKTEYGDSIINGNVFEDMADYLQIADVLITDASSSFFDYALTYRPCFIFFPDVDKYRKERGLYFSFSEMPFPMSSTFQELLIHIAAFDSDSYKNGCSLFLNKIGNSDDGVATERIVSIIHDMINKTVEKK